MLSPDTMPEPCRGYKFSTSVNELQVGETLRTPYTYSFTRQCCEMGVSAGQNQPPGSCLPADHKHPDPVARSPVRSSVATPESNTTCIELHCILPAISFSALGKTKFLMNITIEMAVKLSFVESCFWDVREVSSHWYYFTLRTLSFVRPLLPSPAFDKDSDRKDSEDPRSPLHSGGSRGALTR